VYRRGRLHTGAFATPICRASSQVKRSTGFVTIYIGITQGRCMARGRKTSLTIHLTPSERRTLLAWQRATTIPAGLARRGRIILLLADGMTITDIATMVGINRRFVYKWVQRFLAEGLEGLADKPGRGRRRGRGDKRAHR
jgi:helix-turn-helix protein